MKAPSEKKNDIYRYEMMMPFEKKWACYSVPMKATTPNGYDVTIAAHDAGALNEIEVDFGYPEVVLASVGEEDGETVITFYKNQDVGEAQAGYIAHFVWTTVEDGKQYYSETDNVMATYDNGIITLNEDNGFGFLAYESGVPYAWFEYWMQGSVTFTKK